MANAIYPIYKAALLGGLANIDMDGGTVKAALVDTGTYTYSAAHDFYNDVSGVVGTPQTIANTSVTGGRSSGGTLERPGISPSHECVRMSDEPCGIEISKRFFSAFSSGQAKMWKSAGLEPSQWPSIAATLIG